MSNGDPPPFIDFASSSSGSVFTITGSIPTYFILHTGNREMLKVAEDGFYVRGKKVPADTDEALAVYNAFKQFLVWQGLTRKF
jgi:hypothetical protein